MVVSPSEWHVIVADNGAGSSPSSFPRPAADDLLHRPYHVFRTELFHQLLKNWGQFGRHSAGYSAGHPSALPAARRTVAQAVVVPHVTDRKSTRLNSSHANLS